MSIDEAYQWLGFALLVGLAVLALVGIIVGVILVWREL